MDAIETIQRDGRRWWIRPAAAGPLLAAGWPPDRPEQLTLFKKGRRRTVYRCEAAGAAYFVKSYPPAGLLRRLRARLGLGPGRREWRALAAAREAGLDVPEPVALACGCHEILVTGEIPGARRLDEYLFERYFGPPAADEPPYPGARPPELVSIYRCRRRPPEGTITPRALAGGLADLVARLAEADLHLPDLHPGNILISGGPGAWRLSLVDLAEAEQPAPPESVVEHLVQLEHFFEPIASAAERLRCLDRVGQVLGSAIEARLVVRATADYRREFYRHRDRRTRRESKYFARIKVAASSPGPHPQGDALTFGSRLNGAPAGTWRGWAVADRADAVMAMLAEGSLSPDRPGATRLKDSGRTADVWRLDLPCGRALVLKRDKRAGQRGRGRRLLKTRSLAAFRKGHALLARGIASVRPAAAADLRRRGRLRDTLLVTEPVAGTKLSDWLRGGPPARARRQLVRSLAQMIRRMHDAGFSHRDLKAPNILVVSRGPCGPRPVLVDLDGLRAGLGVSTGRRTKDLMRLSVSLDEWGVARQTDRLRFLRAYLGRRGRPEAIATLGRRRGDRRAARRLRRWWRRIARASARKMAALARKKQLS
jgi:tRNA A-37 threonylcarbamoyl transferase component Bud32